MNSSWSQTRGRRVLTGAALAAVGTVLALAPAASAMADSAPQNWAPAAAQAVGENDPDLGMRANDADSKSHEHGNKTIIICEYCQIANGDIINQPKIIIIKRHHDDD